MFLCDLVNNVYDFLSTEGGFEIPFIGAFLQDLLLFIIDVIGCN